MADKILIDTNVCLDVILYRQPFAIPAARVFELVEHGKLEGFVAAHSFDTMFYIIRKATNSTKALSLIKLIRKQVNVGVVNSKVIDEALEAGWPDIEDAIQYFCALNNKCKYIITRNSKNYKAVDDQSVTVINPLDFLDSYSRE